MEGDSDDDWGVKRSRTEGGEGWKYRVRRPTTGGDRTRGRVGNSVPSSSAKISARSMSKNFPSQKNFLK